MIALSSLASRTHQKLLFGSGSRRFAAFALAVAAGAWPACDKVPLMAPTESTITLYASQTVVPVNGTAEITATVIEQAGTPVQNGTVVTFTTNLGSIEPREARTHNGSVTVRFTAGGQSGEAEIAAVSGAGKLTQTVKILVGGAAAGKIVLNPNPATIPSQGGMVQLSAIVLDTNGNALPGVPVTFTASAGTLSSSTSITNQNGEARATLNTNRETTVTATAGTKEATATIKISAAPVVTLTVSTASPTIGQATVFQVGVQAGTNSAAIQSVSIEFGDGLSASLGNLNGQTSVSHVYRSSGTYTATATAIDTSGQRTTVPSILTVAAQPPLSVVLTATPTNPLIRTVVSFTATVTASGGGATPAIVQYQWNFDDGTPVRTTSGPQTTHIYDRTGTRVVTVTATTTDGNTGTAQIEIIVTSG